MLMGVAHYGLQVTTNWMKNRKKNIIRLLKLNVPGRTGREVTKEARVRTKKERAIDKTRGKHKIDEMKVLLQI